jgi:hypothetical protein
MEYSLLSLQSLAFLMPLVVCAIILNVGLYIHLNFKHVPIKNISMIAALGMLPLAAFLVPLISKMAFDFDVPLLAIYMTFIGICFLCLLLFAAVLPKRAPSIIQLAGVAVFVFGFYSLLA